MKHPISSGVRPLSLLLAAVLAACGGSDGGGATDTGSSNGGSGTGTVGSGNGGGVATSRYSAEIRRTEMGVPHVKAATWSGAGYGYGYAQAQDNLCTMADSFLTYRGERSRYFGGEAQAVYDSTIARPRNIDSDFFHRHVLAADVVDAMAAAQPERLRQLVDGFAAGYNRYVSEARAGNGAHAACRSADWVQAISTQDIWRRMYAANLAGGYSNFVAGIANATPPVATTTPARTSGGTSASKTTDGATVAATFDPAATRAPHLEVGGTRGVGSNMYGFGSAVTGEGSSVLFGNPHWYWKGPDRFYQAQLTIPGELDVSGASFLGVPVMLIGFNDSVAWSHTVSTARRFGFFELKLVPGDPTSYQRDGRNVRMTPRAITVQVRDAAGTTTAVTRTLYASEHGPMINLALLNPALAWSGTTAFAIRDINGANYRTFRNWLRWNQAKSLDEFIAIQREESAIPWVNTVAVGRDRAQAWYADIGAVPNVSPEQVAGCTTAFGQAVAAAIPDAPFFDGSRSACDWRTDADSAQTGAIGPARMPSLLRDDYVGNMNDSHWSTNVRAPLTGFPPIFGPAGTQALTLRTRLGHQMALQRLAGTDGYPGNQAGSAVVRQMVLDSRVFSAERFKTQALNLVCTTPQIAVAGAGSVDVTAACTALRAWDDTGSATARGSHLWDEFWRAIPLTDAQLYAVPFDPANPIDTPRDLRASAADALRQVFGTAVAKSAAGGFAPDTQRGDLLYATRGGGRIPLFGGCGEIGYFTVTCSDNPIERGGYTMDGLAEGNSYMQVVSFPSNTVQAHTFLTFSLSDDPASAHYGDYTRAYGARQWVRMPFTDAEIAASPGYATVTVRE
ncbi:MAG: penicillin acylase family protein [Variovorax sp.]|nr:MAG: penicillin acylase family protein [Variovorax sp.]